MTAINESGAFLFDPIKLDMEDSSYGALLQFNGNAILVSEAHSTSMHGSNSMKVFVLDTAGNFLANTTADRFCEYDENNKDYFSLELGENSITLCSYDAGYYYDKDFSYLKLDLTPMF